jgi:hypothetical protein
MSKQQEALRLAFEALEDRSSLMKWQKARDAIKEALAQPEQPAQPTVPQDIPNLIAGAFGVSRGTAYDMMREALAEQPAQQEPVAWRAPNWGHSDDEWVYRDFDDPVLIADGKPSPNNEPLYTSPPAQRKPLTDEEIIKCWGQVSGTRYGYVAFARAIEAAHGIKENT